MRSRSRSTIRRPRALSRVLSADDALAKFRSRRRVESGSALERALATAHAMYRSDGRAMLEHLHPETTGGVARRLVASAACDYIGWWRPYEGGGNPWPIAFDAKATSEGSIKLPRVNLAASKKNMDAQHTMRERLRRQCQFLLDFTTLGAPTAFGFLLAYDRKIDASWILGPDVLRRILAGEHVKLRDKKPTGIVHHHPVLETPTMEQLARGMPRFGWRTTLQRVHPLLISP